MTQKSRLTVANLRLNKVWAKVNAFLSSKNFFYAVVCLAAIQGLWYALSFRPTILDEGVHLGFVFEHAKHLNPFLNHQPQSLDYLGEITRDSSYLFYYLLSWPIRLVRVFFDSQEAQVLALRLVNIGLFAAGLVVFKKVFDSIKLSKSISNLAILFLILTPALAILPGAVNYDNALLLIAGLLFLQAVLIIKNNRPDINNIFWLLIVGLIGALIKVESLAIFIPVALYTGFALHNKNTRLIPSLRQQIDKLSKFKLFVLVFVLIASLTLFVERPVTNMLRYGSVSPTCTKLLSQERCSKNHTASRNIQALKNKPADFQPMNPFNYALQDWTPGMVTTMTIIPPAQLSSNLLRLLYFTASFGSVALVLIYLREFLKNQYLRFLIVIPTAYVGLLFVQNYSLYRHYGQPIAVTGRYLLPVMLPFMVLVGLSLAQLFRKAKVIYLLLLVTGLVVFTQGGGISTYLVAANKNKYYSNQFINGFNDYAKRQTMKIVRLRAAN